MIHATHTILAAILAVTIFAGFALAIYTTMADAKRFKRMQEEKRAADLQRLAELRAERIIRARRHERRRELDRKIVLLTARSLKS